MVCTYATCISLGGRVIGTGTGTGMGMGMGMSTGTDMGTGADAGTDTDTGNGSPCFLPEDPPLPPKVKT